MKFCHNHRVIASTEANGDPLLSICEVYYDEAGRPVGHNDPLPADATSLVELQAHLASMQRALSLPVLHERDFENDRVAAIVIGRAGDVVLLAA